MKVKDVIVSTLNILGRTELAAALSARSTLDSEGTETVNTLLYCFNAVEDEVARKYAPLTCEDTMVSLSGQYIYTAFLHSPVKITRVLADGAEVGYVLYAEYMRVDAKRVTVEYEYAPKKKKITDDSDFGEDVGERLLALGAAAEYCLINGEVEAAEIWESRYRKEIDGVQKKLPACGCIPPRRWV